MSQIIRILQVVTHMNRGGIETMLMNYYRALDKSKYQFDFLVHRMERGAYDDEIEQLGGRIYRTCPISPLHFRKYLQSLNQFMKIHAKEYVAVHAHLQENSGFVLKYAAKYHIKNRLCTSHLAKMELDRKYLFRILARSYSQPYITQRLACGQEAGVCLYGNRPFTVFPNAINIERFTYNATKAFEFKQKKGWENQWIVGNISRFNLQKNHLFLLEIFSEISKIKENAILVLVGDGDLRDKITQKIQELHLTDKVYLEGVQSNTEDYLNAFDVFLFPSLYEGLPVSVIEAQAAGLPCFLSDTIDKSVDVTDSIRFIPLQQSAREWAQIICSHPACQRPDNRAKLALAGYDVQQNIKQLIKLYMQS